MDIVTAASQLLETSTFIALTVLPRRKKNLRKPDKNVEISRNAHRPLTRNHASDTIARPRVGFTCLGNF